MRPRRGRRYAAVLFARSSGDAEGPGPNSLPYPARAPERSGHGGRGAAHIPREKPEAEFPDTWPRPGLRLHFVRVRGERAGQKRAAPLGEREGRRGDGGREDREERPVPRGSEESAAQEQP